MHCPVWAKLRMAEKLETAEKAKYCTQCMRHDYVRGSNPEQKQHLDNRCGVNMRKNKFSCLHNGYLLHSWICTAHREENQPLLVAHMSEMGDKATKFNFLARSPPPYRPLKPIPGMPTSVR